MKKVSRRKAREDAVKVLFQQDLNRDLGTEEGLNQFREHFIQLNEEGKLDDFTLRLVKGVGSNLREIDQYLRQVSENWRLERMAVVDRNVMRLGVFELCFCDDIAATVTINEMVDLAKTFGSEDSSAFVNGVLDSISHLVKCPGKVP